MRFMIFALLLGCGSLLPRGSTTPAACSRLDGAYMAWHGTALASAGLAGVAGTSGALTAALADDPDMDLVLAVSSATLAVLATVAGALAGEYAGRYMDRCSDFAPKPEVRGSLRTDALEAPRPEPPP